MWEFIKYIFRLLFEGAIGGLGFVLATRFYVKMFIDPKSNLHYDKLIQKVQSWYYQVRIVLLIALLNVFKGLGLIRFSSKEQERDFMLVVAIIVAVIAVMSKMKFNENKKTEIA